MPPKLALIFAPVVGGLEWSPEPPALNAAQESPHAFDLATDDNPFAPLLSLKRGDNTVTVHVDPGHAIQGFPGDDHPLIMIDWRNEEDRSLVFAAINACRIAGLAFYNTIDWRPDYGFFDALCIPTLRHLKMSNCPSTWANNEQIVQFDTSSISNMLDYLCSGRASSLRTLRLPECEKPARLVALTLREPEAGFNIETVCMRRSGVCSDSTGRKQPSYPPSCSCEVRIPRQLRSSKAYNETDYGAGYNEALISHTRAIAQTTCRNAELNRCARAAALKILVLGRVLFHAQLKPSPNAPTTTSLPAPQQSDGLRRSKRLKTKTSRTAASIGAPLLRLPHEVLELIIVYTVSDTALTRKQLVRVLAHAGDRGAFRRISATFAAVRRDRPDDELRARDEWLSNGGIKWEIPLAHDTTAPSDESDESS